MVTSKLTCATHKCLPPLSGWIFRHRDKKKNPSSANSGSKFSRTSSPPRRRRSSLSRDISSFDVKIQSSAINRRICKNLVLFIRSHLREFLYFFQDETIFLQFPADKNRSQIRPSSYPPSATGSPRASSCLRIVCDRYTPPQRTRHPRNARTHAFSASVQFVRRRALRIDVQHTESSLR